MRAPSEGITWRKIDPWVKALDFLGKDITAGYKFQEHRPFFFLTKTRLRPTLPSWREGIL